MKEYGPGNYIPNVFIQYWGMRVMAYLAALIALFALWGLWLIRRKTLDKAKWFLLIAPWFAIAPFLMNTAGWLLTESGRQPWIVQGLMKTSQAASPSVTSTDIWISLTVFVLLYLSLGVADVYLMIHYGRQAVGTEPGGERRRRRRRRTPTRRRRPHGRSPKTTGSRPSSTRRRNGPSQQHLVRDHRHLLGGVLHPRGVRLRRRDAALVRREGRRGASHRRQLHRAHLGRQRGVAGGGGGGDLRRLPVVVCHHVLHPLPGHGHRPSGPDRAGGLLRVPRKIDNPRWRSAWRWSLTIGSALIPFLLGTALGDLLHGLPIDSSHNYTGSFFGLLVPYGLYTGLTLTVLCLFVGAAYLTLKTEGALHDRVARLSGRLGWLAAVITFGWLTWSHVGHRLGLRSQAH